MSNLETDPFDSHPQAVPFRIAAYESKMAGEESIPKEGIRQLANIYGLEKGEAAALAYFAWHRVADFMLEAEIDASVLIYGGKA